MVGIFTNILFLSLFLTKCSGTHVLTDTNFDSELAVRKKLFVKFFAPWCGHCKRLAPQWDTVASDKELAKHVKVVKVDCENEGKKTCGRFGVTGFPTIKHVSLDDNGKELIVDYDGDRSVDALRDFAFKQSKPAAQELSDEDIVSFVNSKGDPVVVAFLEDGENAKLKEFVNVAEKSRSSFNFGYTYSKGAAASLGSKQNSVVLFRPTFLQTPLEDKSVSTDNFLEIDLFLKKNHHGLVVYRTPKNVGDLEGSHLVVYFRLDPHTQISKFRQFRNRIVSIAKEFPNIKFAVSLLPDFEGHIRELFPNDDSGVHVVYYDKSFKYRCHAPLSLNSANDFQKHLKEFSLQVQDGNLGEPYIRSQTLSPSDEEGPVKVVTGKTFRDIVYDETKDVLIEFYSPSCGHCKNLEPIYKELGEKLKDQDNLVIAKIDATANEFPSEHYSITGYPTIFFAKKGLKNNPIKYNGERKVEAFITFLKDNASDGLKYKEHEEL